jgi:hypothetical protein
VPIVAGMSRCSLDRARSLLLALVLGLTLWPIHAGSMPLMQGFDAAPAVSTHDPGCSSADELAAHLAACQMMCGAVTLPLVATRSLASTAEAVVGRDPLRLRGQARGLDPGPPKHHPHLSDA